MDISKLNIAQASEDGAVMVLVHPVTGDELVDERGRTSTITIAGTDSRRFKNRVDFYMRQESKSRGKQKTLAQMERESADVLAHCTLDWTNIQENGVEVPFTVENARRLYTEYGWIRKQLDDFVQEPGNFFKTASEN